MTQEELKSITITPEETKESGYFEFGVHEVKITKIKIDKQDNKPYVEIFVENDSSEDRARLWLHTPDTRRISIDTVRRILVHNQADESIKQKIREKIQQIKNLADFAALLEKTVGCTAWFKVSEDEERTYEKDGKVKKSINRRIYGYEPKSDIPKVQAETKPQIKAVEADENGTVHYVDDSYDEPVDLSDIPF